MQTQIIHSNILKNVGMNLACENVPEWQNPDTKAELGTG